MSLPGSRGRPLVVDLCCGAGGAARGYHDAGCDVIGVDLHPQKNFPYKFAQHDAIWLLGILLQGLNTFSIQAQWIDLIHISPPCQRWSKQLRCRPDLAMKYPDLITPSRPLLRELHLLYGIHWVIENVEGAPLEDYVVLCGHMFGRELYRHRLFEASWQLPDPPLHPPHLIPASKAGHWRPGTIMSVAGHIAPVAHARKIMEIDWTNRDELSEAIPPYYTRWIAENSPLPLSRKN